MTTPPTPPGTRQRLITAALGLLQRKGLHGFGLSEVLAQAKAPKGVLYHHFPGGKVALAIAAIESAAGHIATSLRQLHQANPDPVACLALWLDRAQQRLKASGFEQGCPLAAVALESTAEDTALREALDRSFGQVRTVIAGMLAEAGLADEVAGNYAALIVSAYEGALLQARVSGSETTSVASMQLLLRLVRHELDLVRGPT